MALINFTMEYKGKAGDNISIGKCDNQLQDSQYTTVCSCTTEIIYFIDGQCWEYSDLYIRSEYFIGIPKRRQYRTANRNIKLFSDKQTISYFLQPLEFLQFSFL